MKKIKITGASQYKKGGWSTNTAPKIATSSKTGVSVGTQPYQDWEHRPVPTPYVSDRDRQIAKLRAQQENTPAIGAQPNWQQVVRNKIAQKYPITMGTVGYPLVAAAKLTDPNYSYINGNSGYNAFPGAVEAMTDVNVVLSPLAAIKGNIKQRVVNSLPEPTYPTSQYRPPRGRTFPILPTKTPTGMPTLVDVPELTKEQQILKGHGLNYKNNTTTGINTGSNVTPLSEYRFYGNSPTGNVTNNLTGSSKPISEINWKRWNAEIPDNKPLMDEYHAIEQTTKANGSWMKNPDGSAFQGSPEQFVQQNSQNFKKAFPGGHNEVWRGVVSNYPVLKPNEAIFTGNKDLAKHYSGDKNRLLIEGDPVTQAGMYNLAHPKSTNSLTMDALGKDWASVSLKDPSKVKELLEKRIPFYEEQIKKQKTFLESGIQNKDGSWSFPNTDIKYSNSLYKEGTKVYDELLQSSKKSLENIDNLVDNPRILKEMRDNLGTEVTTDDIAKYIEGTNLDYIKINNIDDGVFGDVSIVNHKKGNYLKSLVGNNGMFDMTNPNIYKTLLPIGLGAAALSQENKQYGGVINNDMKKVLINRLPQYTNGGWAQQVGGRLNTRWPPNNNLSYNSDDELSIRTTLPKVPRDMANAVLENDEIAMLPTEDGLAVQKAASGSHASGNDHPTVLEEGSMIISDTKSLKEKSPIVQKMFNMPFKKGGYTYSEFGAPYMRTYNKAEKSLATKKNNKTLGADPYGDNTDRVNMTNAGKKLQQVFQAQEFTKMMRGIPGVPAATYATGGQFRFDESLPNEQARLQQEQPLGMYMANQLYGQPKRGTFVDNIDGPRTRFVRNMNNMPLPTSTDNIGSLPAYNPPSPDMSYQPQEVAVPGYTPDIKTPTWAGNALRKTKDGLNKIRIKGLSANNIADMAMAAKSASVKKYTPWEPAIQIVRPDLLLESDQPIRNVLAEQTNQLTNAMYAGNSSAARAGAQNAQAQMLARAVQAAGEVSNRNVQNYNQFSQQMANLENARLMQERERGKRLYDGNVIADQQYRNSLNSINDMWSKAAAEREQQSTFIHNQNKLNPYYQLDSTGKLQFVQGMDLTKMRSASGSGDKGELYAQLVQQYSKSMDTKRAEEAAYHEVFGTSKTTEYDSVGRVKKTKEHTKKYGGFMSKLPKR